MDKRTGWVMVTGDIVCDCHMYGGLPATGSSAAGAGASLVEVPGGAALTLHLLRAAANPAGLAWDEEKLAWAEANRRLRKSGQAGLPKPAVLKAPRPPDSYATALGLEIPKNLGDIPTHLRSFGVWTAQTKEKGSKEEVWRIKKDADFGYGPFDEERDGFVFVRNHQLPEVAPVLTVIDDGALRFRHGASQALWPNFAEDACRHYLLKTTRPLVCGDLWSELSAVKDRLIVVVSAGDLRRMDIQIDTQLSWEQCAEHTLNALRQNPVGKALCASAAHLIVTFGSAGAFWMEGGPDEETSVARLVFDPSRLENEYEREMDGTVYGFQSCFTVAIAHHLMRHHLQLDADAAGPSPFSDRGAMDRALLAGIAAGIEAKRQLVKLGHGPVGAKTPGIQAIPLGKTVTDSRQKLPVVEVPEHCCRNQAGCQWTILTQLELAPVAGQTPRAPLTGLGLTTRYGVEALADVPALRLGPLYTVDRSDVESLRTLESLMRKYEDAGVQKKPLCIGVFGPPGAGKSFGVKALAQSVLGPRVPFLEFNLSQFKDSTELVGAFHRVRDEVLRGVTPVAFWDEFDSREYEWLQYLLAPMQDGTFQEGQITHPLGKCVFVFAGGTAETHDTFGVEEPNAPGADGDSPRREPPSDQEVSAYEKALERHRQYKLRKGPDFVSRLHGFLDVLGPNQREGTTCVDNSWPIRRAIMLRGILGLKDGDQLDIDLGLLYALLKVPRYKFGARSFERIVKTLQGDGSRRHLNRSDLPPRQLLELDTSALDFEQLLARQDAFLLRVDIDRLAAGINEKFAREFGGQPDWKKLSGDEKDSNRAAARRMADHLALIDFAVEAAAPREGSAWQQPLENAIERHLERLAKAEHADWCAERMANGWTYGPVKDNSRKRHPLLIPWKELHELQRDKDREIARWIPEILKIAKHKAVPVRS